jgi:hypothetical protein
MGAIARNIANKITTSGVFTSGAITNSSVTGITVLANASDGITLISSQTASNSASISFTSGLTSTYKAYKFVFVNIHPQNGAEEDFLFQTSTNGGSSYGVTCTSTYFTAYHHEGDAYQGLTYDTGNDLAQSTSFQKLADNTNNNDDGSVSGNLELFNPSSTTYVKHFIGRTISMAENPLNYDAYMAGYFNTTSAINAIQFKFSSGNIADGKIYMYGIK